MSNMRTSKRQTTITQSNTASFQSYSLTSATSRAFDDSNVHPILTAIDIQPGMIMRMLFDYAVTQLQHFLIECGRTSHTILQPDSGNQIRRLPDSTDHSSGKQEWQHHHKELRSIQFTITRRSRASTQNTVCTNQNTQGTNQAELQQRHSTETSTHALDRSTQCLHHEQICDPQQWMHKLLQQIEQGATYTTSQVW